MAGPYTIDWQPPNLTPALALLMQAKQHRTQNKLAEQNAKTQAEYARLNLERESNRAAMEKREFERGENDRREKAFESARILMKDGDTPSALSLLKRHGIESIPEMGAPTTTPAKLLTPASVLASQPMEQMEPARSEPVSASMAPMTPVDVMRGAYHGTGTTVPEEPTVMPQVEAPDIGPSEAPYSAANDLMPFELEPETTTPGAPTGAYSFKGAKGEDMGRFDPSAQRKFREERAGLAGKQYGGIDPKYGQIAESLIAQGVDPTKVGPIIVGAIEHDAARAQRESDRGEDRAARDALQEDRQKFDATQNELYRRTFGQAMALARADAARRDPAGGASPEVMAALSDYAIANPGDIGGLYRQAGQTNAPLAGKAVSTVVGATKPTESQAKDAKQAAIGFRAIDAIEQSQYAPDKETIQKWLNNQREVYQAQKAGEGGGILGLAGGYIAGKAQKHGLMAQSEVEGLPPEAANYFANVRRFMETIGRAQSGAAISPTEWQNFFNQYGPNSPGGITAAKQYMADQLKASGVAGRSIAPAAVKQQAAGAGSTGGQSGLRTLRMPDGSIARFDASGKRVE